jgi:O-antigen ligase
MGRWCGWVLVGVAALTPLLAWLGPLGFAPLMALAGLLCLPALRIRREDAPLLLVLLLLVGWAALSTLWSPRRLDGLDDSTALKLGFELVLFVAVVQGAGQADAARRRLALRVFAWGLAAYGVVLAVEAFTGGSVYLAIRNAVHDPIRPDLGRKNLAQGSFALALLWPVAAAGGWRAGAPLWLAVPMAAGAALLAQLFLSDAPVLAVGLALLAAGVVVAWPQAAPKTLGVATAVFVLLMPVGLLALLHSGRPLSLPLSWSERMGYWLYATARIAEHPLRGWGLDASRTFGPAIGLHPHNNAVQIWLELGVAGASLTALAWAIAWRRLSRERRSLVTAATAGSVAVYLFFGAVSFGVWQEWWLALGALACVIATLGHAEEAAAEDA